MKRFLLFWDIIDYFTNSVCSLKRAGMTRIKKCTTFFLEEIVLFIHIYIHYQVSFVCRLKYILEMEH